MNLLALDTSTEKASIALWADGVLSCVTQDGKGSHAQLILPLIASLLNEAGLAIAQLDGIAFGRGPGSFTGLRIACSVAKGLAYAHDLPLYPVSSLAAIAEEAAYQKTFQPLVAMLDARMNQVYWAYFSEADKATEEQVTAMGDIDIPGDLPFILAGVGFEAYQAQLSQPIASRLAGATTAYPTAAAMIRLVQAERIQPITAAQASPVYVRNQITQGEPRG